MRRKNLGNTPRFRAQETRAESSTSGGGLTFIASDETPDRYGEVILVSGWRLENFRKNPVLLLGHDYGAPAIGRVGRINAEATFGGPALVARDVTFGRSALAQEVRELFEDGAMSGVSVGFISLKFREATPEDARRFQIPERAPGPGLIHEESELLEISAVSVPANPNALIQRKRSFSEAELAQTLTIAKSIRRFDFDLARRMENAVSRVERYGLVCSRAPSSPACRLAEQAVFQRVSRLAAATAALASGAEPGALGDVFEDGEPDPWGLGALLDELATPPAPEEGDPIDRAAAMASRVSRNVSQLRR